MQLKPIEKFAFLQLAHHLAKADGDYGNREKKMIEEYCIEMGIDDIIYDKNEFSLEECLNKFQNKKGQRILLLELMILVHVDDKYNQYEQELIQIISKKFDISDLSVKYASSWGKAVSALREQALLIVDI
jgi:uncharacterized tellurite resistance protein B-like protein